MPSLTEQEIKDKIDAGEIAAISIDTNVFHRYGYDLESAELLALDQFSGGPISFVVSDIVVGEVKARMHGNIMNATDELRRALRKYQQSRRLERKVIGEAEANLALADDVDQAVADRWDNFVSAADAKYVTAGQHLNGDSLVTHYFETKAPFEASGKKKEEFPDAIALLELEALGEEQQKYILAVSNDNGWTDFASSADWVVVVKELRPLLSLFHQADKFVLNRTIGFLNMPETALGHELVSKIQNFVDDLDPNIDASTYLPFDVDFQGATYDNHAPLEEQDGAIVDSDDESVTMTIDILVNSTFAASFAFSVHDSIDDDYVSLGSTYEETESSFEIKVVLQVFREAGPEDESITMEVEASRYVSVDFGEIEPFSDEGPED